MPLSRLKTFTARTVKLPDLSTEEQSYGRGYIVGDEIFPSITTVVSIHSEEFIQKWKERVGEDEARRIGEKATTKGNALHEICERYINNELNDEIFQTYSPEAKSAFIPIKDILDQRIDNILAQEVPLYSTKYRVAGRVDLIAEFDGILSIIDFKTSSKQKQDSWIETYFMQETAYALMFYELKGIRINQIVTIMTVEEDAPQVFVKHPKDYFHMFVATRQKFKNKYGV